MFEKILEHVLGKKVKQKYLVSKVSGRYRIYCRSNPPINSSDSQLMRQGYPSYVDPILPLNPELWLECTFQLMDENRKITVGNYDLDCGCTFAKKIPFSQEEKYILEKAKMVARKELEKNRSFKDCWVQIEGRIKNNVLEIESIKKII